MSDINQLTEMLASELQRRGQRMVTAESCTGGLLAAQLTSIAGSSDWFEGGFVSYRLSAKQRMLDISGSMLERFGAVSEPVARAMAEGALRAADAHLSVAITGVAGPAGGDVMVPVGTVWFAWATRQPTEPPVCVYTAQHRIDGAREEVRHQAMRIALEGSVEVAAGLP